MDSANMNLSDSVQLTVAKRRARNRVSQKSFRERQTLYVRQLERQLEEASQNEGPRIKSLQEECQQLRKALLTARKRIAGLRTSLTGVSDNIGIALGLQSEVSTERGRQDSPISTLEAGGCASGSTPFAEEPQNSPTQDGERRPGKAVDKNSIRPSREQQTSSDPNLQYTPQTLDNNAYGRELDMLLLDQHAGPAMMAGGSGSSEQELQSQLDATILSCMNVPTSFPKVAFNQMTRTPNFEDARSAGASLKLGDARVMADIQITFPPGNPVFPSVFSAHLAACEFFIKQNNAYKQRSQPSGSEALLKLISNMVNMFVNTAWPDMRVWWAYMQSSRLVEKLIRWKLDPSLEAYQALSPTHRPTATQLSTIHPAIIDWGFFPSVRDRLIELYAYSPSLDQLMCELLAAYVVEGDLGALVTDFRDENGSVYPQKGYFRIWDIVQAIEKHDPPEPVIPAAAVPDGTSIWQDGNLGESMVGEINSPPPSPFTIDEDGAENLWSPMPLADIFRSKRAAQTLFKLLHMDERGAVKLDPVFAVNHPELCDDPSILASGMDCTLRDGAVPVPPPRPLTRETIMNYKMMLWKTQA